MAKPHLAHPSDATLTRCELPIAGPWPRPLPIAEAPDKRTCRRCLRALAGAVEAVEEPPFAPSSHTLRPDEVAQRMRSRTLSRAGQRAIERSVRGEPLERTWSSAEAALRAWMLSGPPSPMRSSSDFGSRVQASRDPSLGGAVHAEIDRHRTASLAWRRAFERLLLEPAALAGLVPWAVERAPSWPAPEALVETAQHVRGLASQHVRGEANAEQLADDETHRWRHPPQTRVTAHQIRAVVRHFVGAVRDALVASGEMQARAREEREPRRWDPLRRVREREVTG